MLDIYIEIGGEIIRLELEIECLENSAPSPQRDQRLKDLRAQLRRARRKLIVAQSEAPRLPGF